MSQTVTGLQEACTAATAEQWRALRPQRMAAEPCSAQDRVNLNASFPGSSLNRICVSLSIDRKSD